MIAVVTAVNVWGTRKSSDLQNWTTLIKALAVVLLSAVLLALGHHAQRTSRRPPHHATRLRALLRLRPRHDRRSLGLRRLAVRHLQRRRSHRPAKIFPARISPRLAHPRRALSRRQRRLPRRARPRSRYRKRRHRRHRRSSRPRPVGRQIRRAHHPHLHLQLHQQRHPHRAARFLRHGQRQSLLQKIGRSPSALRHSRRRHHRARSLVRRPRLRRKIRRTHRRRNFHRLDFLRSRRRRNFPAPPQIARRQQSPTASPATRSLHSSSSSPPPPSSPTPSFSPSTTPPRSSTSSSPSSSSSSASPPTPSGAATPARKTPQMRPFPPNSQQILALWVNYNRDKNFRNDSRNEHVVEPRRDLMENVSAFKRLAIQLHCHRSRSIASDSRSLRPGPAAAPPPPDHSPPISKAGMTKLRRRPIHQPSSMASSRASRSIPTRCSHRYSPPLRSATRLPTPRAGPMSIIISAVSSFPTLSTRINFPGIPAFSRCFPSHPFST